MKIQKTMVAAIIIAIILLFGFKPLNAQGTFYDVSGYNVCVYTPPSYSANPNKNYPVIIFMPGAGEIGTDKNKLVANGPNAFVKQGWNGTADSVEFIVASFQQKAQYSRPWTDKIFFDFLFANFRVDKNNIFGTGLSRGWWHTGHYATYQKTPEDLTYIKTYKGLAIYEGQPSDDKWDATLPYPQKFGRWAKINNGYLLAVHNRNSAFYADAPVKSVNDSVPGHAFYFEPLYGNGGHCCWSSFYGGGGVQPAKYSIEGKQMNVYEFFAMAVKKGTPTPEPEPEPSTNCDSLRATYNNLLQQINLANTQYDNLKTQMELMKVQLELIKAQIIELINKLQP